MALSNASGIGPSNMSGLMSKFGRPSGGMSRQRFMTPGLNPGQPMGQPTSMTQSQSGRELVGPGPIGQDRGLSTGPIRPPRSLANLSVMPQIQQPMPGGEQPQYAPMMPSGNVINKFISPQPGAENMPPPGGFAQGRYTLPWQRRLF